MVKLSKNDMNSTVEKIKDEIFESTEGNAKRKCKDEDEDIDEITLLDGLSVPKDGSVPAKKRKKIATADKILKLEQEKVRDLHNEIQRKYLFRNI